jgi:hypothetical protein
VRGWAVAAAEVAAVTVGPVLVLGSFSGLAFGVEQGAEGGA